MKRIINLILSLVFSAALISLTSVSIEAAEKIDRDKILESEGVIRTFGLFKVKLKLYFSLRDLRIGITKGLNYANKTPDLLTALKGIKYEGPAPIFGIMVTVDKTSDWWNLSDNLRIEMIREHAVSTLHFIK